MVDQRPAPERIEKIEYLLRRAEQESIAAIRAVNGRIAEPHDVMAQAYSVRALAMLDNNAA